MPNKGDSEIKSWLKGECRTFNARSLTRSLALSFSEYELHTVWHIEHRLTAMQFEFVELYRLRVWADDGDGDGGARDIAGF